LVNILSHDKEQFYVAELRVPSYFYLRRERRGAIPNPSGFGINKAYWIVRPPDEQPTVKEHPELIFIIEFVSTTLKEAEDHVLKVGRIFSSIASACGGFPVKSPYLYRIASIDLRGDLISQHNYWYTSELLSGFDQTVEHQLQKYFMCASAIDGKKDISCSQRFIGTELRSVQMNQQSVTLPHGLALSPLEKSLIV
jgi:hypothetical protein